VLVKSWQRLNNAQYVLKEHPELFSSFAAAYRRQCEPRARQRDPARSLSPCPAPRQHDAPRHAPTSGTSTDGERVEVPDEGDHYWNFSGDLRNPQWCASATAILQSRAAQDLLDDPAAQYNSIPSINACVVYDTPQARSYEVPSTPDLEASYEQLPRDLEVDAQHGRLEGTVRQTPPFNRAMLHASSLSHIRRHTLCTPPADLCLRERYAVRGRPEAAGVRSAAHQVGLLRGLQHPLRRGRGHASTAWS